MTTPKVSDLISTEEAAKILGQSQRTVQRMVHDGRLTAYTRPIQGKGKPPTLVDRRQVEALKSQVIEIE